MELSPKDALLHRDGRDVRVPSTAWPSAMSSWSGREKLRSRRRGTGESEVNQAPITGESLPVVKRPGDEVFAGTINATGLTVRVTHLRGDTPRADHRSGRARAVRARALQTFVERFAGSIRPVVGLAGAVAVVPPLLFPSRAAWVYRRSCSW